MPGSRPNPPAGSTHRTDPRAALEVLRGGPAGGLLRRAQWLAAVDLLLRPHLPPGLSAHARLANVRGDKLVFVVDAPVWHAKVRLAAPELVNAARSIGLEVTKLSVSTTTQPLRPLPLATAPRTPMSATAQAELATALAMLRPDAPETSAPKPPNASAKDAS